MVTNPCSHQCCQHSLEQGRSPCANYPRLPLWASPVSRGCGETSFQRTNSCLEAGPGLGVLSCGEALGLGSMILKVSSKLVILWFCDCPSPGGERAPGGCSCSKGLSFAWGRPPLGVSEGVSAEGGGRSGEQGMFPAGVSQCRVRLGNTSTSCSSCCPGTLPSDCPRAWASPRERRKRSLCFRAWPTDQMSYPWEMPFHSP